jgi:hypothetical protein
MTSKDKLFTRTYSVDEGEVVVVGNRRDIANLVPGVIEAEVLFRDGELVDAHITRFKQ